MTDWFKMPHGMPYDLRIGAIARRTGLHRTIVIAIFLSVMDYASRNMPRGSVRKIDAENIAAGLDIPAADVAAVIAAMREKEWIDARHDMTDWHTTQNRSTERVRAYRARQQALSHTPEGEHA